MLDFDTILTQLPSLKNLLDTHGPMSLFDYAKKYYHVLPNESPLLKSRKKELLDFLGVYVTRKFGKKYTEIVIDALARNYAVSTAEHHGPMGHPFFFQSALLRAISQPDLPIVNFATSHVSLGNSSYPRGLVFHGDGVRTPIEYLHLPFFGSKSRMCPVFGFPAYTQEDIEEHCIKRLQEYHKDAYISEEMYKKIGHFITSHVLDENLFTLSTYSEQITQLNHTWWKELFPEMPPYISLDAEDIVVELLQEHLLSNTLMAQIITDSTLQSRIEKYFDGISCCFDLGSRSGTYLFWYLDENNRRHALWREGDELVSPDNSFRMKMTSEEYRYHFEHKHLIPSGLLVYTLFTCYYGLTCFGGFAQGEYLPKIQQAFHTITTSENLSTQGSILNEDLVFLFQENGEISTAIDLYILDERKSDISTPKTLRIQNSIHKMQYEICRCF